MEKYYDIPQKNSLDYMEGIPEQNETLELKRLFLSEGVESWSQTVKDYWVNYDTNKTIEFAAKNSPETQINHLLSSFNQGVSDIHHRLASNIGAFRNSLKKSGFFTEEQFGVLEKIQYNSTDEGKIKRYKSKNPIINSEHPVHKIYDKILSTNSVSSEELEVLKKDAYDAGQSTAIANSVKELISWFYWAGGLKFIQEGNQLPQMLLKFRKGEIILSDSMNTNKEEYQLLTDILSISEAFQTSEPITPERLEGFRKIAEDSYPRLKKIYTSENHPLHPSFLEYLEEPLKYPPPQQIRIPHASEIITFCELRLNWYSIERPSEIKLIL